MSEVSSPEPTISSPNPSQPRSSSRDAISRFSSARSVSSSSGTSGLSRRRRACFRTSRPLESADGTLTDFPSSAPLLSLRLSVVKALLLML